MENIMRYFRFYYDDMMNGCSNHGSADLVNRKPVIMSFMAVKPKRSNGRKSAATKLAINFANNLEQRMKHGGVL